METVDINGLVSVSTGNRTIIAHENNKGRMQGYRPANTGGQGAPPAGYLPNQLVSKNKETRKIDGVKVELLHWEAAFTIQAAIW